MNGNEFAIDAMLPVQIAQLNALEGDSELMSIVSGVFDKVPEGTVKPYVVIGEAITTPDNSHDRYGKQVVVTNHIWTEAEGHLEGLTILNRMVAVLEQQPLTVEGLHHVSTKFEFAQTLRDPDPVVRHQIARFRVTVEQGSRF